MTVDIYLDVDGVINAVTDTIPDWGWDCEPQIFKYRHAFTITVAPPLVQRLNSLAARRDVQFHWLTTWLRDAPSVLCDEIGLCGQDWPVLGEYDYRGGDRKMSDTSWWKGHAVIREAGTNPLIWIDDDLRFDIDAIKWCIEQGDRVLGIAPRTEVGLTLQHLDGIEAWIDEQAET